MTLPVKEVDFPADDQEPMWLDHTRVLFSGGSASEYTADKYARMGTSGLYIWDIEQKTITKEPRFTYLGQLCVQGRYISYVPAAHEGKGTKRQVFVDGQRVGVPEAYWFNPMSCRIHTTKPAWWIEGRVAVPLLEEHGYIDFGANGEAGIKEIPIQHYRPGGAQPIPLSLKSRYVSGLVHYIPFLDAYILRSASGRLSAYPLWLLHPNGTVEQVFSPEGKAWAKRRSPGRC